MLIKQKFLQPKEINALLNCLA